MASKPIKVVTRKTLTEQTYEVLKGRILDREIEPGTRLNIDSLVRDLGVSTSPLREALAKLQAERLVVSELYSGYSVAPEPTLAYLRDLIDYRILLEGRCALVGAIERSPAQLQELRVANKQMAGTRRLGTKYREYAKFVAGDARFHQIIVESGGNQVFIDAYQGMHAILLQARLYLHRFSGESRAIEVADEHARILQAFEDRDGVTAETAIRDHLEGGKRRLLATDADPPTPHFGPALTETT